MRFITLLFLFSSIGVVFLQMHDFSLVTIDTSDHFDALPLMEVNLPEKECVQKYKIKHTDTGIYYDPSTQRAFPSSGCHESDGGIIKLIDLHEAEGLSVVGSFPSKNHLFVEYVIKEENVLIKHRFLYNFSNRYVQALKLPQDYYFSAFGINESGDILLLHRHLCLGCGRVNYFISVLGLTDNQYTALGLARFGNWSSNSSIIYYPMVEKDSACNSLGDGCFEVQKHKPIIWDRNSGGKNANIVTTAIQ